MPYSNVTVIDTPSTVYSTHKSLGLIFGMTSFSIYSRGVEALTDDLIGSAQKLLAMGFGTTANSTFVPDSDKLCAPNSPQLRGCLFWRGGVFSPDRSTSWVKDKRVANYNGSASNDGWDYLNGEVYKGSWWIPKRCILMDDG